MPTLTNRPLPERDALTQTLMRKLEDLTVSRKLALLIRLSRAVAVEDRGGTNGPLDTLFWLGVADLCWDMLHEIEDVEQLANTRIGFVTIADAGGAK